MTDLTVWLWMGVGLLSLLMSALYAGAETGIYCLSPIRLQLRSRRGWFSARALEGLLKDSPRLIVVILIGTNLANYLLTVSGTALLSRTAIRSELVELYVTFCLVPIVAVFGEMVPKMLFQNYPDRLTYATVRLLMVSKKALTWTGVLGLIQPIIGGMMKWIGGQHSASEALQPREEMMTMLQDTAATGLISRRQNDLAQQAMAFAERRLDQLMEPLGSVPSLPTDSTRDQCLKRFQSCQSACILLYGKSPEAIEGVVDGLDLLLASADGPTPAELQHPPCRLRADMDSAAALTEMQRHKQKLALVIDPAGRPLGLVRREKLIEGLLG